MLVEGVGVGETVPAVIVGPMETVLEGEVVSVVPIVGEFVALVPLLVGADVVGDNDVGDNDVGIFV